MLSKRYLLPATLGSLMLVLTFARSLTLSLGTPIARTTVGLSFMALGALALFLLYREGISFDKLLLMLLPIGAALLIRVLLLDHVTLDYQDFLSKWVSHFRQNGGFLALKDPIGNYNVPYLYMLAFLSYLPIPDLYGIKLFSILFDILLAWGGLRLVKHLTTQETHMYSTFGALLLLPTVVLNGSCWGQCDSVWAALCLLSLSQALDRKQVSSMSLLALAFSFKLQAIFILPLWCVLWFTGRMEFRKFFVFPFIFLLTMLPALLFGKPISDILNVYVDQAGSSIAWQTVNYNSPSIFALLPYKAQVAPWIPKAAIFAAFLFVLAILLLLFVHRCAVDDTALVLTGAALSLGVPFLLPYMHERYFFLGGVLLVVLACSKLRFSLSASGAELASLGGYHAYLARRYFLVLSIFGVTWAQLTEGLLMLFSLSSTLWFLWRELSSKHLS